MPGSPLTLICAESPPALVSVRIGVAAYAPAAAKRQMAATAIIKLLTNEENFCAMEVFIESVMKKFIYIACVLYF